MLTSHRGSIATLIRIKYIHQLAATSDFLCMSPPHHLLAFLTMPVVTTNIAMWSTVEPGIGIIAASIATYRPLFRSFFSKLGSLRPGTHRTPPAVGPSHSGYKRTSSVRVDISPDFTTPSSSTMITGGAPSSKGAKRWFGRNERYEMDEGPWRGKKCIEITSSETHVV